MIRKVVLPNICCMLLVGGYVVFMFMWLFPHLDIKHSMGDAFVAMMNVQAGLYGLLMPVARIIDAYVEKKVAELDRYNFIKNTFALFNQYNWSPDWNLRDFSEDLREARRLGIDKELSTSRDCRLYLYGWDPEENRPPMPKFDSGNLAIIVDGVGYCIPSTYIGLPIDYDVAIDLRDRAVRGELPKIVEE